MIQGRFQYDRATCSYKVWPYAGQSQLDAKIEYSWNFNNIFDLHRSPVDRQTLRIWTVYFLCVTLPSLSVHPVNMKAWTCTAHPTVVCQIWGQFRWNLVIYGSKCPILKGVHQTARSPKRLIDTGLNHSGSIPIWSGDQPAQLQGLTLCGSVTAGRQNWIFLKF